MNIMILLALMIQLFLLSEAMQEDLPAKVEIVQIATGEDYTCLLSIDGVAFCGSENGQSGGGKIASYPNFTRTFLRVDMGTGRTVKQLAAGGYHTCMLLDNNRVKCFGSNDYGQLGLGDTVSRSNQVGEMGDNLPHVNLGTGQSVKLVVAGTHHTCVLFCTGRAKCFGANKHGQLGTTGQHSRGAALDDMGYRLPYVDVGDKRTIKHASAGSEHTCMLLDNDEVKCFGHSGPEQLGADGTKARDSLPTEVEFFTRCQPGFKSASSNWECSSCSETEHGVSTDQETCLACVLALSRNATNPTSCTPCPPGTHQNVVGSTVCTPCAFGTYQEEFGSLGCKPCPPQRTTTEKGQDSVESCVAPSGFMDTPRSADGVDIQNCDGIIGADCSSPGATLETLPLKCGFWRPNPNTTDGIQFCPGGCDVCQGGDTGTFGSTSMESTKYCALGHVGPLCSLCASGLADVFQDDSCVPCDSFNKEFTFNPLLKEQISWVVGVALFTAFYVWASKCLNQCGREGVEMGHKFGEEKRWRYSILSLETVLASAMPFALNAMFFYQILAAYSEQFFQLRDFRAFNVDIFSMFLVTHPCDWDPSFRDRLLIHANGPILLGIWVLLVTVVMNKFSYFVRSENAKSENYARASLAALFFVVLAYPGVERRALGAFVCKKFVGYDGKVERLLSADLRVDCDSQDHLVTEGIAVVYILLYTLLVPGVFIVGWLRRDRFENQALEKAKQFLFSSYEVRGEEHENKRSMGWFLALDTVRVFMAASLLVFVGQQLGDRTQVYMSMHITSGRIGTTYFPFRREWANVAMVLHQLFYLPTVILTLHHTDMTAPLGSVCKALVYVIVVILVPVTNLMFWLLDLRKLEGALYAVKDAVAGSDVERLKTVLKAADQLGLKVSQLQKSTSEEQVGKLEEEAKDKNRKVVDETNRILNGHTT